MLKISICDDEQDMLSKVQEVTELFFRTHCVDYSIKISAQASIVIPITAAIGNTSYGLSSDSHIQYA